MYITSTSENKSAYDILSGNVINICAISYHIFILLFNNYYIYFIINNKEIYYVPTVLFNLLEENLVYCQIITLFTAAFIILSEEIAFIILQNKILARENSESMKFIVMFISYLIKCVFCIYQFISTDIDIPKYIYENPKIIHSPVISLIIVSYNIRVFPFIIEIGLIVSLTAGFILQKGIYYILYQLQKFKDTYTPMPIEYIDNTNL